jgi:hypothetical protein
VRIKYIFISFSGNGKKIDDNQLIPTPKIAIVIDGICCQGGSDATGGTGFWLGDGGATGDF